MAEEKPANIQIIPENVHASFFNVAIIPGEVHISFGRALTGVLENGAVQHVPQWTHVVSLSAIGAKALLTGLSQVVSQYEKQFGYISSTEELVAAAAKASS